MVRGILVIVYGIFWDFGLVWEDLLIIYNVFYCYCFWVKVLFSGIYF